jgi:hypothetical protein
MTLLPGTGSDAPSRIDLEARSGDMQKLGWGCNPNGAWASVHVDLNYLGVVSNVRNTRITVYDENPYLPNSRVATGYTDDSGNFSFRKPTCDYGAPWDMSQPDLFFVVESADARGLSVNYILFPYSGTHSVRTGTYWDTRATTFNVSLRADRSSAEKALGVLSLIQKAAQFNVDAGGPGANHFPLRVSWPTHVPGAAVSFAMVTKLELTENDWNDPFSVWHEFGHELMYYTATPSTWSYFYSLGSFSVVIPAFSFGSHSGEEQQDPEIAYNDGWANYFATMMATYYGQTVGINGYDSSSSLTACNGTGCRYYGHAVWANGNENEMRVATFLYRYTLEVLQSAHGLGPRGAFGRVRERLWNVGRYDVDIHESWQWWLRGGMPSGREVKVRQLASDTLMNTSRIP